MKKKLLILALAMALCSGCASINTAENDSGASQAEPETADSAAANGSVTEPASGTLPADTDDTAEEAVEITLNGSEVNIPEGAEGVSADGTKITVTAPGRYYFTGKLDDGQIIVSATKEDKVELYLDGAEIDCLASAPIRIESADGCTLHLVEGSTNVLKDGTANEFSACISAKDDLTIKGKGKLFVYGSTKHGIKSSNDLRIKNGVLEISAVKTGIYAEDKVEITGGNITVTACKDGIKATDDADPTAGTVTIEEADIDIQNAQGNGIEAAISVTVTSGSVKIHSIKQAVNCATQSIADGCVSVY
ncbi:MAG: carbohydrate-binding domain-containing protein [Ruminococcus sp.]|nr:carbohydrate-binding domain-containing protein [Ruminococcus sp.]